MSFVITGVQEIKFLGPRFKEQRLKLNMSASKLGDLAGYSRDTILNFEANRFKTNIEMIFILAEVLGIQIKMNLLVE